MHRAGSEKTNGPYQWHAADERAGNHTETETCNLENQLRPQLSSATGSICQLLQLAVLILPSIRMLWAGSGIFRMYSCRCRQRPFELPGISCMKAHTEKLATEAWPFLARLNLGVSAVWQRNRGPVPENSSLHRGFCKDVRTSSLEQRQLQFLHTFPDVHDVCGLHERMSYRIPSGMEYLPALPRRFSRLIQQPSCVLPKTPRLSNPTVSFGQVMRCQQPAPLQL